MTLRARMLRTHSLLIKRTEALPPRSRDDATRRLTAGVLVLLMIPPMLGLEATPALADPSPAELNKPGGVVVRTETDANQLQQCLSDLRAASVEFQVLGNSTKEGCQVEGAVELDSIPSSFGNVLVKGKPIMTCLFARQLTIWIRDVGAPLTLAYMGSKLTTIETAAGFVCRARNNQAGEKISEHAKGNAIDITGFRIENGQTLSVRDSSASTKIDGVLLKTFRATGCGYFTTVLGPGSDDAHKDHIHFDYGLHGGTRNYRICD